MSEECERHGCGNPGDHRSKYGGFCSLYCRDVVEAEEEARADERQRIGDMLGVMVDRMTLARANTILSRLSEFADDLRKGARDEAQDS